MVEKLTLGQRRLIRLACNAHRSCPIKVVKGRSAPKLVGESYHYRTRGGRRIHYPNAYSKKGWGNMMYVPSSLCIEVGEQYLK